MDADRTRSLFDTLGLDREGARRLVAEALASADDGELFLEHRQSESLVFDNGRLRQASTDSSRGFGLRAVAGEASGYAHSSQVDEAALKRAAETVRAVASGHSGTAGTAPAPANRRLYAPEDPLAAPDFAAKVALLEAIDSHLRAKDPRVVQVTASLAGSAQIVEILRADGAGAFDARPLVRLNVSVIVEANGRRESGSYGMGGRTGFAPWIAEGSWRAAADAALAQALVNLEAVPAPAGSFDIVLGPGWPGVLLHEAVGHGLEGDFNRKKTSAFAGLMGQRVASPGVTVVDDGTIEAARGSLSVDDEGAPTESTVLIEDGVLVGYMQDRQNARLMGQRPTGNGRRESYAHAPMPRMTNTYMLNGPHTPDEILESVADGIYAVSFGGGQVDITSGKFVFQCTEAYRIENGRVGAPIKGAMLIGNGPDALTRVRMVGNDMALDRGQGTCGKAGQWVPVGVGQPTMRIDAVTVGGTGE